MSPRKYRALAATVTLALSLPGAGWATNGFFTIGYGSKNRGQAGAGIAHAQDAMAAATNPAGITRVGNRIDAGLEVFNPNRSATVDASGLLGERASADSGSTLFAIPHFGLVRQLDGGLSASLVTYANGGMNTRYNDNIYANAFGPAAAAFSSALGTPTPNFPNTGTMGVNLAQLIIAPSLAYEMTERHSLGASLLVGYQTFRGFGLGLFSGFSNSPENLTNNGNDDAWGLGARIGWNARLTDYLSVGATYSSKIYMQEFDKYKGLFSEQGDFDIPANYGVGITLTPTPRTTLSFDVTRILYNEVATTGNQGPTAQEFIDAFGASLTGNPIAKPLGTSNGLGFGWDNQTVYKLGLSYDYNRHWTFRAGFNYAKSPIDDDQNLFNVISLAVVEKHATVGFSYRPNERNELTFAYMRAFPEEQSFTFNANANLGAGPFPVSFSTDIEMDQHALEFSYAWKF